MTDPKEQAPAQEQEAPLTKNEVDETVNMLVEHAGWSPKFLERNRGYAQGVTRLLRADRRASKAEHTRLMGVVQELEKDKARLDFLDRANVRLNERFKTVYRWELIMNHNVNRLMLPGLAVDLNDARANGLPSCRDAIDAKMASLAKDQLGIVPQTEQK